MNIECKTIESVTIIKFAETDRLYALNAEIAKEKMNEILTQQKAQLIVDCENISFIDSSGFGALLSALKTSKQNNSTIKLCNINNKVMELVKLMQLDSVFDIYSDQISCVSSF